MGMVRLAEVMINGGEEPIHSLVEHKPGRALEALRLAIVQAETEVRGGADWEDEAARAIAQIRDAAASHQSSERRTRELEAALDAARRDVIAAQDQAERAAAEAAAEAKRANSAEARTRQAEEQLREIMAVIEKELAAGRPAHG